MSETYYDGLSSSLWANDQAGQHPKIGNKRSSNGDDDYENKWSPAKSGELVTMANGGMMVGLGENSNWRNNNGDNEVYSDTNDADDVDVDEDEKDEDDDNTNCNANTWSEKLTPHSHNRTMNWILSETHSKDKTVKFRYVSM